MDSDSETAVDLGSFKNEWFDRGASRTKEAIWYLVSALVMESRLILPSRLKAALLRAFGADVGNGVVLKPSVRIKFPWRLRVGEYVWIGEGVWIDNLAQVSLGSDVCISQGAMVLTGNHDFRSTSFDLVVGEVEIGEGAWLGARSLVGPGVRVGAHAVLTAGSVATSDLAPKGVYQGNPARLRSER